MIEELIIWLISTAVLWVISISAVNLIEATVHSYWVRLFTMIIGGGFIGVLASAVGYTFLVLSFLLFLHVVWLKRKLHKLMQIHPGLGWKIDSGLAWKYVAPSLALIAAATLGSYVFSTEICTDVFTEDFRCKRIFFDRIYTPPHLIPPNVGSLP